MKIIKKIFRQTLVIVFLLISCKSSRIELKNKLVFDSGLRKVINSYIKSNPLIIPVSGSLYKKGFSYPSYHIFFNKVKRDTLMQIVVFPHLNPYSLKGQHIKENSKAGIMYKLIKPSGVYMYRKKYPLVFFGIKNYKNGKKLSEKLIKVIPDSLQFRGGYNYHYKKYIIWNYVIKNSHFISISHVPASF